MLDGFLYRLMVAAQCSLDKPPLNLWSNGKIEVPETRVIQWKWSDATIAKMKIEVNLKQARDSSNKPLKRTKCER